MKTYTINYRVSYIDGTLDYRKVIARGHSIGDAENSFFDAFCMVNAQDEYLCPLDGRPITGILSIARVIDRA